MKASTSKRYGEPQVFELSEIIQPKPTDKEVLIKMQASTVTGADLMMRKGKPRIGRLYLGLIKPKVTVLGFDFAGEVVQVGPGVSKFKVGDKVFGGSTRLGCYAEYTVVREDDVITQLPKHIDYKQAAPITGSAITVMNFLIGLARLKAGDKLLINGASGGLGTYAIQLGKHLGAEVTAITSTKNSSLVKQLGADVVIDYTQDDFTQYGERYDVIFDTLGKLSYATCKPKLTDSGIFMSSVLSFPLMWQMLKTRLVGKRRVKSSSTGMLPVKQRLEYLLALKELLAAGKLLTVVDKIYPLEQMAEAHSYVQSGRKRGHVIITPN